VQIPSIQVKSCCEIVRDVRWQKIKKEKKGGFFEEEKKLGIACVVS